MEVPMAELRIEGDELVLHLSTVERVESVHRDLHAPLTAVRAVEVLEDAHGRIGWRSGLRDCSDSFSR
jgi:hypothetical protein